MKITQAPLSKAKTPITSAYQKKRKKNPKRLLAPGDASNPISLQLTVATHFAFVVVFLVACADPANRRGGSATRKEYNDVLGRDGPRPSAWKPGGNPSRRWISTKGAISFHSPVALPGWLLLCVFSGLAVLSSRGPRVRSLCLQRRRMRDFRRRPTPGLHLLAFAR